MSWKSQQIFFTRLVVPHCFYETALFGVLWQEALPD